MNDRWMKNRYQKIVEPVEAIQWCGENENEITDFCKGMEILSMKVNIFKEKELIIEYDWVEIKVKRGDYLVNDPHNGLLVVKEKSFDQKYKLIGEEE